MLYDLQVLMWQNGALAAGASQSEIASYLGGGYGSSSPSQIVSGEGYGSGNPDQAAHVADPCCGCIML